ncbi:hypothetical protein ANANG_G00031880 [Anguilla anguilla]|uniref:Endoplasmic reticulum resident protein 27 n=1 Tax=Anguilla anguilla TaxID=7936 RepID=A0A9D3MU93_ANGAN|nr:hypothetical protein ANANG_G00031880 [Anguilla anguilla]
MLFVLLLSSLIASAIADEKARALPKLTDVDAVESFIDAAEVVVIGFFQMEVWAKYSITTDTISIFRKADLHQENLQLSETKKLDSDGLTRFFQINELHYITEYNPVTAVGLFNSDVKTHLLLFVNRGAADFTELKERLGALAPEYTGQFLFVLVNGALKSNARSLGYFGLKSRDLPKVGIYDGNSDRAWLLPPGEISTERVREFCESFLNGTLQEQEDTKQDSKTEL